MRERLPRTEWTFAGPAATFVGGAALVGAAGLGFMLMPNRLAAAS